MTVIMTQISRQKRSIPNHQIAPQVTLATFIVLWMKVNLLTHLKTTKVLSLVLILLSQCHQVMVLMTNIILLMISIRLQQALQTETSLKKAHRRFALTVMPVLPAAITLSNT